MKKKNKNIGKVIYDAVEFNNIKEILLNSAKKFKDKIAFVIKHEKDKEVEYENVTYERLLEDINKFGTAMYKRGFENKRVAVIGKNRYEWMVTHFSSLLGNMVSVPLDKDLQYEELENSLVRSEAECIVYDEKQSEKIEKIKEVGKTNIKEYICMSKIENENLSVSDLILEGEKLIADGELEFIQKEVDSNKMSILLFTSGTTSKSKAVMLSQKNVASNIFAMQQVEDIRQMDTNIAFLPFHHIFGMTCMTIMLANGVKTLFPDGLKYIKKNLKEYKVSIFVGVPALIEAMYKAVLKEVEKQGKAKLVSFALKLSNFLLKCKIDIRGKLFKQIRDGLGGHLRLVIYGGAKADPEVIQGFENFGIKAVQGYGLTETAPVIAAENELCKKKGSVGVPMLNDTIEIDNPDANGIGEIKVKGPNVMLGYYNMPEETAAVLKDGWFYTGDLGKFDEEGFLFITGRSKNMIVLKNGKKIFPEELEMLVNRLDFVEECIVFGMPDKKQKDNVKLSVKVVYDKEKCGQKTENEVYNSIWDKIKELNQKFPKYKHIQNLIVSTEELIKTTTQKVKRQDEISKILQG